MKGSLGTIGRFQLRELLGDGGSGQVYHAYDPRLDRWHAGPTMPEPMEIMGATVVGDRIYAVFESITLVYDARTSHWSRGPSLQVPRHALALFYVGGRLYAIGGCIVPQLEDSQVVETLDLKS